MSVSKLMAEAECNFEATISLQEKIYSLDSLNLKSVLKYILTSGFVINRESFSILLKCIDYAFAFRPLSSSFYIEIIRSLSDKIQMYFSSYDLFTDLIQSNYLRYKFYELGFINISTIICYLKERKNDVDLFFFFAFEVKAHSPDLYLSYTCQSYEFRKYLNTITPEQHSIYRSSGLNQDKLAFLIRSNDAVGFQSYHSSTNINLDQRLTSYYEECRFSEKQLSLIEYAAFFGAIDVFKYLILNNATFSANLPKFAVIGGNYEIIHILEQNGLKFNDTMALNTAIKYHRNDIVEYIKDSLGVDYTIKSLKKSLKYYNLPIFIEIMKRYEKIPDFGIYNGNVIDYSCKCGYFDIVKIFSKLIENSEEKNKLLKIAVNNRRFDVFMTLHSIVTEEEREKINYSSLFLDAALKGHLSIFQYLIQFIDQNYFEIFDDAKNSILSLAAIYGDLDFVKYIISLGPTVSQLNHRNIYGV